MLLLTLTPAACGAARLYQWRDAQTGITQLSGRAPVWYREEGTGPRVLVFERGQLVDDTARAVDESQRRQLRAAAFGGAAPVAPATSEMPAEQSSGPAPSPQVQSVTVTDTDAATVARMRAIVRAWDGQQEARARAIISGAIPLSGSGTDSAE
ncbi:MAG: hypothetical protein H6978_01835 [Gammaproteobacteria bacterium]|nr:hypothetical protein [Gammaproteobacteria bacterium]